MQLFFAEKPAVLTASMNVFISKEDYSFSNNSFKYKFELEDYTLFSNPQYLFTKDNFYYKVMVRTEDGNNLIVGDFIPDSFMDTYDLSNMSELLIGTDFDHAGIRSADLTLKIFKKEQLDTIPVSFLNISNLSEETLKNSYLNRTNYFTNLEVSNKRKQYQLKDYLDYNINGIIKTKYTEYSYVTRNMLWILLLLKNETKKLDVYELQTFIDKHKIGSAASQSTIQKILIDNNLIDEKNYLCSSHATAFLNWIGILNFPVEKFKEINDLVYSNISLDNGKIAIKQFLTELFNLK